MEEHKDYDLLLTSPPFLDVERYCGVEFENDYSKWLNIFVGEFTKRAYSCLVNGGKMAVYLEKIDSHDFPKDFSNCAISNGFKQIDPVKFKMSYGENTRNKKVARIMEVLVFQK